MSDLVKKKARGIPITEVRRRLCTLVDEVATAPIAILRDGRLVAMLVVPTGKEEVQLPVTVRTSR